MFWNRCQPLAMACQAMAAGAWVQRHLSPVMCTTIHRQPCSRSRLQNTWVRSMEVRRSHHKDILSSRIVVVPRSTLSFPFLRDHQPSTVSYSVVTVLCKGWRYGDLFKMSVCETDKDWWATLEYSVTIGDVCLCRIDFFILVLVRFWKKTRIWFGMGSVFKKLVRFGY